MTYFFIRFCLICDHHSNLLRYLVGIVTLCKLFNIKEAYCLPTLPNRDHVSASVRQTLPFRGRPRFALGLSASGFSNCPTLQNQRRGRPRLALGFSTSDFGFAGLPLFGISNFSTADRGTSHTGPRGLLSSLSAPSKRPCFIQSMTVE